MTCQGPMPLRTIQVVPINQFRKRLGTGISPEIKKAPQFIYRPVIGIVQVKCCNAKAGGNNK